MIWPNTLKLKKGSLVDREFHPKQRRSRSKVFQNQVDRLVKGIGGPTKIINRHGQFVDRQPDQLMYSYFVFGITVKVFHWAENVTHWFN